MNIIDAVKSGKPYKRRHHGCWFDKTNHWRGDDILATDWEIEERKIEITENEFEEAFRQARQTRQTAELYANLKKRLFG
jgi:hypothetical protein